MEKNDETSVAVAESSSDKDTSPSNSTIDNTQVAASSEEPVDNEKITSNDTTSIDKLVNNETTVSTSLSDTANECDKSKQSDVDSLAPVSTGSRSPSETSVEMMNVPSRTDTEIKDKVEDNYDKTTDAPEMDKPKTSTDRLEAPVDVEEAENILLKSADDKEKAEIELVSVDSPSETTDSTGLDKMTDDLQIIDDKDKDSNASETHKDSLASSEDKLTSVEVDLESQSKEDSSKSSEQPENTEFVQIVQDKQDESQIESQSMDAEDPFGGDALAADSESLDTVDLEERNINFQQLGDQADNLQDILSAKDSTDPADSYQSSVPDNDETTSESDKFKSSSKNRRDSVEKVIEEITIELTNSSDKDDGTASKNDKVDDNDQDKDKKDEDKTKSSGDQSSVLPGQDDELCIVPDNTKIVTDQPTDKEITTDKINEKIIGSNDKSKSLSPESIGKLVLVNKVQVNQEASDAPIIAPTLTVVSASSLSTAATNLKEKDKDSKKDSDQDKSKDSKKITGVRKVGLKVVDNIIDVEAESKNSEVEEISRVEFCKQCKSEKVCSHQLKVGNEIHKFCSSACQSTYASTNNLATDIPSDGANSKYEKRCANCLLIVETNDERNLSWETMEFCNEECLGKFQTKYGSYCRNCNGNVAAMSLGKYCVRFGYDVRQFCCSTCLEEFKKGLKVCSYCQKDISSGSDGFLAPVGDKGQFKDFCTQFCMEKYSKMNSTEPPIPEKKSCSVCQEEKIVYCEVQVNHLAPVAICSEPCFAAFKFVNKVDPDQCSTCKKYFDQGKKKNTVVFYQNEAHTFCNKTCLNIFIITHRKIVPCNWCKVKKYNFDMIKKELKNGSVITMCSLNCLTLYQVSMNAVSSRRINCDFCKEFSQAQYHLTMSDATIRNFCCYDCVMKFQGQYTKSPITIPGGDDPKTTSTATVPVPTGTPKRTYPAKYQMQMQTTTKKSNEMVNVPNITIAGQKSMPVISSVKSLASNGQTVTLSQKNPTTISVGTNNITNLNANATQVIYKQQVITRPVSPVKVHNKMTQCKPLMHTKGVSVKPHPCTKSTQTDEIPKILVPIPVPIYVPFPVHMWSFPFPVPVPFPLPIPVPIFIPTTRNSTKGIFKELKRIQDKMPSDPFEAELLMMAEMVATDKKTDSDSSDSADENNGEVADGNNTLGDDMLQEALKMTTGELEDAAVDLEAALTPNTITAAQNSTKSTGGNAASDSTDNSESAAINKGRKRVIPFSKTRGGSLKKGRRSSSTVSNNANDVDVTSPEESIATTTITTGTGTTITKTTTTTPAATETETSLATITEPLEKPDANMALKYTFGVNAWRKWVVAKNNELEKQITATKKLKLFKTDLLQLTADELNYSLCHFVKEVRKPNGAEYAPDTIYYLCLGIQQYLFENNRIDNIFTDTYYEQFTDCLNDVAKKFSVLYNDAQYIVTRVEEEHLWECKQLGAHSPHVLLNTLMFFNTKHFNLTSVEEHMQLSFSHIMKHWKRNPIVQNTGTVAKTPGSRNVLLRFYPPQSTLEANSKKKKVYEQQENEENPLRCPVKLYEFYISKCPESVKTRNDVFYLLPERSCVPDSPVWYSTSPLAKEHLVKMLNRVKMVKEINIALLST
ncbi:zinc finger MYM-type protein 3 [Microplitis demolitor]|uniref:zinc finger MYM-type protein 3 n=1 Tax=Microplitis demolitor TaxID=69319 RepID=UPI0004CC9B36|nr:zinc finger MYM-type protein 3 [Microplitis demolitor]